MPEYRRNRVPGGTYFFTVNLFQRDSHLLVDKIDNLRESIRTVRNKKPFHIDGWVVLPDHMHLDLADGRFRLPLSLESDQNRIRKIHP